MVINRFGSDTDFKLKANPSTQYQFGMNPKAAVMGDYPTLTDINLAYGRDYASEWLLPHITDLSVHTGARNLTLQQIDGLSRIIAAEYRHFKVTEILLFFYRFKAGRYGRFYGSVDPMVITCALRDFSTERNMLIEQYLEEEREQKRRQDEPELMNEEEWLEIKTITAMYNSEYTVP